MSTMLKLLIFGVLLLISGVLLENNKSDQFNFKFQQNEYQIIYEHAEVISINKYYVQGATVRTFKYNRTCTTVNISATFNVDLGNNMEVVAQAYRFASNEYRLFPMRFQFNFCDALSKNLFGFKRGFTCGNFTGCPIEKKRNYRVCNFIPDTSNFPMLIPNGRYMVELQVMYLSNEICVVRGYGEITRPFTGK